MSLTSKEKEKAPMKAFWKQTKKTLSVSCAIFTVIYFFILIFSGLTGTITPAIPLKNSLIVFLLSLLLASCDMIFEIRKINFALKLLIHFAATLVSLLVSAGLAGYSLSYKTPVMLFVFIFLYAFICPIYILAGKKHKKGKTDSTSDYVSIFKKD